MTSWDSNGAQIETITFRDNCFAARRHATDAQAHQETTVKARLATIKITDWRQTRLVIKSISDDCFAYIFIDRVLLKKKRKVK